MENFRGKKRPTISLKLFSTLSDSFSNPTPTKSPRNFQDGVVGLGIVAAITDSAHTHQTICFAPSPRSTSPIPIASSDKAKPNFGGGFDSENSDELSENPTCVVSNFGDDLIKKQFYFCDSPAKANMGRFKREFWGDDFLTSCHLCKKELHGLDIFMYRGEKAFCSVDCRDKQITSDDDHKQSCGAEARKGKPLDCSEPALSCSPQVLFAVVAAA